MVSKKIKNSITYIYLSCLFVFICGCSQMANTKFDSISRQYYIQQQISAYKKLQYDIFLEYKNAKNPAIVERNQYILSKLWKDNLLDNQLKTEIAKEKYKLVLLQLYGNYQSPNFAVFCKHDFPFPFIWTKFTPTLLINDKVEWDPQKPQTEHSMAVNNSTITSRSGGIVKNGDTIQYKVILQQYSGKELLWETCLYTNKVIAQGLKK